MNYDDLIHYANFRKREIAILESRFEQHDTGHIRTCSKCSSTSCE
jgi:hypothetical protein